MPVTPNQLKIAAAHDQLEIAEMLRNPYVLTVLGAIAALIVIVVTRRKPHRRRK